MGPRKPRERMWPWHFEQYQCVRGMVEREVQRKWNGALHLSQMSDCASVVLRA